MTHLVLKETHTHTNISEWYCNNRILLQKFPGFFLSILTFEMSCIFIRLQKNWQEDNVNVVLS